MLWFLPTTSGAFGFPFASAAEAADGTLKACATKAWGRRGTDRNVHAAQRQRLGTLWSVPVHALNSTPDRKNNNKEAYETNSRDESRLSRLKARATKAVSLFTGWQRWFAYL